MYTLRPLARLLPFVAAAVLVLGCDGFEAGTPPDQIENETPTVRFSSSNVGAIPSDSLVTLTVELLNGNGSDVSVEVLYAQQASTTTLADLDSSIAPVTELTLSGSGDEVAQQTIEVNISNADIDDGRKEAFFALQNVQSTGSVALGDPNQLTLNIGFPPLSDIRAEGVGTSATFEAIVTETSSDDARVQDETAGIQISRSDPFVADVEVGDLVRISGTVSEFANQLQIDAGSDNLANYEIVSEGNDLPSPQEISVTELTENFEEYESELVRITDLTFTSTGTFVTGGSDANFTATDPDGNGITVRIVDDSFYDGASIPTAPVTFEGVAGEFFGSIQLRARYEGDLTVQ